MPKMKSHRGAKKRLKVTGTGKLMRKKANASHILTKKTRKRKRKLRQETTVDKTDAKKLRKLIQA